MPKRKLLFLTLNTFSSTGGVEKVCRIAGKAMSDICSDQGWSFGLFAMNDKAEDLQEAYLPASCFTPFNGRRQAFVWKAIMAGRQLDTVVLSHVNLLVIGGLIKLLSPKTNVFLIAHGIEVWRPFSRWKKYLLKKLDQILPVSEFTCQKMKKLYGLSAEKLTVVNNCLDPLLPPAPTSEAVAKTRHRHGIEAKDKLLFTLTRLKSSEQYKGYDRVISVLPQLVKKHPTLKYLIAGKYDEAEKNRLDRQIAQLGVAEKVVFAGFIRDEEVAAYFGAADVYIMPSTGEGFGVVFIEALHYGLPVIAGNIDGSTDALAKGAFGRLVNPHAPEEVVAAVEAVLHHEASFLPKAQAVHEKFGFNTYKQALKDLLFPTKL